MEDIKAYSEYVYILDFRKNRICEIGIAGNDTTLNSEQLLNKYGLNIDNCNIMYSTYKLNLENINKHND